MTGDLLNKCKRAFLDHVREIGEFPETVRVLVTMERVWETPNEYPPRAPRMTVLAEGERRLAVKLPPMRLNEALDAATRGSMEMRRAYMSQVAEAIVDDIEFGG